MTLDELLEIWRTTRSPRVADAIDRMTEGKAITAKTIKARHQKWMALAEARSSADVGALVATDWSRTIGVQKDMIDTLLAWDDDPRIAQALARFVETGAVYSIAGRRLEILALRKLAELRDTRTLPRLRGVKLAKPELPVPIEQIEATPDTLDDATAAKIEALFVRGGDEAGLLAAIYENPDDLASIQVYGDWLAERGDPRGEFIALQLAGEPGERLVEQHGRAWAGALDPYFADHARIFERGFLAGGTLVALLEAQLDEVLEDPAWRTVRTIDVRPSTELVGIALARHPKSRVRTLGHVSAMTGRALANGEPCELRELFVRGVDQLGVLATAPSLPALEVLGLEGPLDREWTSAPILDRIRRVVVTQLDSAMHDALAARDGALREIEIGHGSIFSPAWTVKLVRDAAPGPFSTILATRNLGDNAFQLVDKLGRLPNKSPRALLVTSDRPLLAAEAQRIDKALDRFTQLDRIELPWKRSDRSTKTLAFAGSGAWLKEVALADLWDLLAELGQRYEVFTINNNVKQHALGKDPKGRLEKRHAKGMMSFTLAREGAAETFGWRYNEITGNLVVAELSPDALADAFARLLATAKMTDGTFGVVPQHTYRGLGWFGDVPRPGWIMTLDAKLFAHISHHEIEDLARTPLLGGLTVTRTAAHVLVRLATSPDEVTAEVLDAFQTELGNLLLETVRRRLGFDPYAQITSHLAPVLQARGFRPLEAAIDSLRWSDERRYLNIWIHGHDPKLYCYLYDGTEQLKLVDGREIEDADDLAGALDRIAQRL